MPSMYEIYEKHSYEYDELLKYEDFRGNLQAWINEGGRFKDKAVLEFGCGTGRVTAMYAPAAANLRCFDRSEHMLERAESKLAEFASKIEFGLCDNSRIGNLDLKADIVIEGWSFGHTVDDSDDYEAAADRLIADCKSLLRPGGQLIFIESLGTNFPEPAAPTPALDAFFRMMEDVHGFTRTVLSTDYRFPSDEEARRIAGFFFGEEFGRKLVFREKGIIREYTGVWTNFC